MEKSLVSYLKIAALGVVAFAMAACARTQAVNNALAFEPRVGEPPKSRDMSYGNLSSEEVEAAHVERLAKRLDEMTAEIAMVREALKAMGPLPEQAEFFIPIDTRELDKPLESRFKLADLYADAPVLQNAKSLFEAGEDASSPLRSENRVATLASNIRFDVAPSGLLNRSDLSNDPEIDALCVELSALAGACTSLPIMRGHR